MEKNRRNYYRILKVQPDASQAVIRSSYRTLLQKLRMHPDLGGNEWNASLMNQAYNTLRHPNKRQAYDQQLLKQYCIKQLSRGHIRHKETEKKKHNPDNDLNQRNYYRILHVQSDSPSAIIHASFAALIEKTSDAEERALLKDAFHVLTDKDRRAHYDELLKKNSHAEAVKSLHTPSSNQENLLPRRSLIIKKAKAEKSITPEKSQDLHPHIRNTGYRNTDYNPIITQYCPLCKTPHNHSPCRNEMPLCLECSSPLYPPSEIFLNQARRDIDRLQEHGEVFVYYDWPSSPQKITMTDISPTGICINSEEEIEQGLIIKIDADNFKAIGEITYSQRQGDVFNNGVRFLTIQFNKQKGQFLYERT